MQTSIRPLRTRDHREVAGHEPDGCAGAAARIADYLQSAVVSRLFTAGLSASSLAARHQHDPDGRAHALAIVAELDDAIAALRTGIVDLRGLPADG